VISLPLKYAIFPFHPLHYFPAPLFIHISCCNCDSGIKIQQWLHLILL